MLTARSWIGEANAIATMCAVAGAEIYRWLQPRWPQSAAIPASQHAPIRRETKPGGESCEHSCDISF